MPNDLYRWEDAGGLVHHCPKCFQPLTRPQARTKCLGNHAEWCKRYHTQLFMKGTTSSCDPCVRSDDEHFKRHRAIAELLAALKQIKVNEQDQLSTPAPLTPRNVNALPHPNNQAIPSSLTKKERKAIKKAKKISDMPKAVSTADIDFIATVLHPGNTENEDADIERQLLDDADIKLNRAFHAGTSNRRDIRNEFITKDKRGNIKVEMHVDATDFAGLLQLLNVSPLSSISTSEEVRLHSKLKAAIEQDLIQVQKEDEMTMMRKAGFWRWASKKAYNRLVQNGRIWGQKSHDGSEKASTRSSAESAEDATDADDNAGLTDCTTEPDTDVATTPTEELSPALPETENLATPKASAAKEVEEGWTTIAVKSGKAKKEVFEGNLKLAHNGGLSKMALPVTPIRRKGFANMWD